MKQILILFLCYSSILSAQENGISKTKFVVGIAGPELIHAGITYRIANSSSIGGQLGIGPTMGGSYPSINLEHRLYIGKNDARTNQKKWFIRQGITYYPGASDRRNLALTLTGGLDMPGKKKPKNGFTIDAGAFYLGDSEQSSIILVRSLNLWPALRFQFYFGL